MYEVLQLIREAGAKGIGTSDIAALLGLSSRAVRYHIDQLEELHLVVRPTPRGPVYATGQKPRRRTAAPRPQPHAAGGKPPVTERPTSAEKSAQGATVFASLVLGPLANMVFGLGIQYSARLRQWLNGKASRWPETEAFLRRSAAGHPSEVREHIERHIRAVGRFYTAAREQSQAVEFRDMLSVLSDEKLVGLREQARQEDPTDELSVQLADEELKRRQDQRRAAQEREIRRQQGRSGVPAPAQGPDLHVVKPAPPQTNGGLQIRLGIDPFTGKPHKPDWLVPASVSQSANVARVGGYVAGRYVGGEVQAVSFTDYLQQSPAGWRTREQARQRQLEEGFAAQEQAKRDMAVLQAKDADMRRRTGGIFCVDWDGRTRRSDKLRAVGQRTPSEGVLLTVNLQPS